MKRGSLIVVQYCQFKVFLQVEQELAYRCVSFLKKCLDSSNQVKCKTLLGRGFISAECCLPLGVVCSMFGVEVNIDIIKRKTAWFSHSELSDSDCCKVNIMSELLCCEVSLHSFSYIK